MYNHQPVGIRQPELHPDKQEGVHNLQLKTWVKRLREPKIMINNTITSAHLSPWCKLHSFRLFLHVYNFCFIAVVVLILSFFGSGFSQASSPSVNLCTFDSGSIDRIDHALVTTTMQCARIKLCGVSMPVFVTRASQCQKVKETFKEVAVRVIYVRIWS